MDALGGDSGKAKDSGRWHQCQGWRWVAGGMWSWSSRIWRGCRY